VVDLNISLNFNGPCSQNLYLHELEAAQDLSRLVLYMRRNVWSQQIPYRTHLIYKVDFAVERSHTKTGYERSLVL